jgi:hypothetical protein
MNHLAQERWDHFTYMELIWHINDPEAQEPLIRYLKDRYTDWELIKSTVSEETRIDEIKSIRLSILSLLDN